MRQVDKAVVRFFFLHISLPFPISKQIKLNELKNNITLRAENAFEDKIAMREKMPLQF